MEKFDLLLSTRFSFTLLSMLSNLISLTILSTLIGQLYGYAAFRTYIPNGEVVPHPCNPNWVWEGVGHIARGGGGERNPFGLDFYAQGKRWNVALCEMDSDGDGKTNGEELGDPNCEWAQGEAPLRSTGLSHPGICDPLDSDLCTGKHTPNCEEEEFKCDAINEIDVKRRDIRLPVTKVPPRETVYMCMYFDLPQDGDYHMVASTPIIDNINVMHHMLVYACSDPDSVTEELNTAQECFMGSRSCTEIIAAWAVGQNGECYHPSAGFRIGNNAKGFKRAMIELHWNNPAFVNTYTDSSGVTLYLTPNLRPYDAGVLLIGQQFLEIPPQTSGHIEESVCSSRCTRQIMTDSIYVIAVQNHMHYLGRKAVSQVVVPGTRVNYLAYDQVFNYDRPVTYGYDVPLKVDPGHELKLTCHFTSTSRTKTTYYGDGTNDEMCFAFITYYPKENLQTSSCISYGEIDPCEFGEPIIKGCNLTVLYDPTHPENVDRYTSLMENCQIGSCKKECKAVVKEINQHPCYTGSMRTLLYESSKEVQDETQKAQIDRFWGWLRSCDGELATEACSNLIINTGVSDSAGALVANLLIISLFVIINLL